MYIPASFNDSSVEEVKACIAENGFGILINTTQGALWATHIPMELTVNDEGEDVLVGHIAKANKQWRSFEENNEVLAIFQGPHAYVSSTWYNHNDVPTWNYIAVHIYGHIKILEGKPLYNALKRLVHKYETITKTHLDMEDLPERLLKRELRGIVGFEITIRDIQAAFKLSQKKDHESYTNIVTQLENSGNPHEKAVSERMKDRRKDRFTGKD